VGEWNLPPGNSGAVTMTFIAHSLSYIAPLRAIGFAVLTLILARKLLGFRKTTDQILFDVNELEPHLRDAVNALQDRGLSPEEAFVIATRHSGQGHQFESERDRDTIWFGRAIWMLIGIQVWPFFERLMSGIAGDLFAFGWGNVRHSPFAMGDAWPVFFSSLVQLPALVLAVWLFWKVLRSSGKLGQWIETKLSDRSSFVLCCIAASIFATALFALEIFLRAGWHKAFAGLYHIQTVSHIDASKAFVVMPVQTIGFVILTLMLARKLLEHSQNYGKPNRI
jgi:hypothetical protein